MPFCRTPNGFLTPRACFVWGALWYGFLDAPSEWTVPRGRRVHIKEEPSLCLSTNIHVASFYGKVTVDD